MRLFQRVFINFSNVKSSRPLFHPFCTAKEVKQFSLDDSSRKYEDWQYTKFITSQLKTNNIDNALRAIFQSYFNGIVLDMQIFNQIQLKINENNLSLSYSSILYTIYRENFQPSNLIMGWMNKLSYSTDEKLTEKLKKDYESLNHHYPVRRVRSIKKEQKLQKEQTEFLKQHHQTVEKEAERRKSKFNKQKIVERQEDKNQKQQEDNALNIKMKDLLPEAMMSEQGRLITKQIKGLMKNFFSSMGKLDKVTFHDVEVVMAEDMSLGQDHEMEDYENYKKSQDEEDEDDEELADDHYSVPIQKIKIGKIEFIKTPIPGDQN